MILLAQNISKSFGAQLLYAGATLQLNAQERWALVGPNGAGKTTLLRIIMGLESADEGSVSFARDTSIGYLEQESGTLGDKSVLEEVVNSATEIRKLGDRIAILQTQIAQTEPGEALDDLLELYGRSQNRFESAGGYELESKARQALSGLGFSVEDFAKPARDFSGGWQTRIALAKLLLRHPDLLLLDEPTNHLDLESVQWLESFLSNYEGAVLLVSHDRSFIDACVTHIAAIENRQLTTYVGTYSDYLRLREDNLEQLRKKRAAQERDIAHMQVFVDRFRYKPTKARQVQERIKRIEQIREELVVLPDHTKRVSFSFPDPPRSGDMVVNLENVTAAYGNLTVYKNVNLTFYRGDRVCLVGPNGAGKSTLMKLIVGALQPQKGCVELGLNVTRSYYSQHQLESLDEANTVLAEIDRVAPRWTTTEERRLLGAFLFHGDDVEKRVSVLSGGERARLALAKMIVSPDPLLCLDEPTNHLDIDSINVLEHALQNFPGTIVLISHDEHLVRAICNKVVDIHDGVVTLYDGDYEYYRYKRAELLAAQQEQSSSASSSRETKSRTDSKSRTDRDEVSSVLTSSEYHDAIASKGRNVKTREQRRQEAELRNARNARTRRERMRLKQIEDELEPMQARYSELMELMATQELYDDRDRFDAAMREYEVLTKKIPQLETEWFELTEELEATLEGEE